MTSDTARLLASAVTVAMVALTVLLAAFGCRDFITYLIVAGIGIFAVFVASTQDA
jgi:hypothetical protein